MNIREMRKEYVKPEMTIYQFEETEMICQSLDFDSGGGSGTGGANDRFDGFDFDPKDFE